MRGLDRTLGGAAKIGNRLILVGGFLLLASAFLVTTDVLLRKFFNYSIGGADEISGYAFGVSTALALSSALLERSHIRVDAVYTKLPLQMRVACDFLGLALLIGFGAFVSIAAWQLVADTVAHGSRSITPMRTPLIIPQLPWLLGWLLFVAFGCVLFIAALARMAAGNLEGANDLIGIRSAQEEVKEAKS